MRVETDLPFNASQNARLGKDPEGTGPTTSECPGLAGLRQTDHLPMDPFSKVRPEILLSARCGSGEKVEASRHLDEHFVTWPRQKDLLDPPVPKALAQGSSGLAAVVQREGFRATKPVRPGWSDDFR